MCQQKYDEAAKRIFQLDSMQWKRLFVKYTSAGVKNEATIALAGKARIDKDARSDSEILYAAPAADPELPWAYVCPDVIIRRQGKSDFYCQIKYKAKSEELKNPPSIHRFCPAPNTHACKCPVAPWYIDQLFWEGKVTGGHTNYLIAGTLKHTEFIPLKPIDHPTWWRERRPFAVQFYDRFLRWYWEGDRSDDAVRHMRRVVKEHNAETEVSEALADFTDDAEERADLLGRAKRPIIDVDVLLQSRPESDDDMRTCRKWTMMRRDVADQAGQLKSVIQTIAGMTGLRVLDNIEGMVAIGRCVIDATRQTPQRCAAAAAAASGTEAFGTTLKRKRSSSSDRDAAANAKIGEDAINLAVKACRLATLNGSVQRHHLFTAGPAEWIPVDDVWNQIMTYVGDKDNEWPSGCQCDEPDCETSRGFTSESRTHFADMIDWLVCAMIHRDVAFINASTLLTSFNCYDAFEAVLKRIPELDTNVGRSIIEYISAQIDPRYRGQVQRVLSITPDQGMNGACACQSVVTSVFRQMMNRIGDPVLHSKAIVELFRHAHDDGGGGIAVLNMGFRPVFQWITDIHRRMVDASDLDQYDVTRRVALQNVSEALSKTEERIRLYQTQFSNALCDALTKWLPVVVIYPLIRSFVIHPARATARCGMSYCAAAPKAAAAAAAAAIEEADYGAAAVATN